MWLDAPWYPDDDFAFTMYAARTQQIEDFINALAVTSDPNDYSNQCAAAECAGLDLNSLTSDEINYIESEVARCL